MAIREYSFLGYLFWSSNVDWVVGMVDRARANFKLYSEVALQLHDAYIAFSMFSLCDSCLLGEKTGQMKSDCYHHLQHIHGSARL